MATRDEAEKCAASAPVGLFGIDDLAIAVEVITLGFKLWQTCSSSSSASDAVTAAGMAGKNQANFRRAQHRVHHAARKHGQRLSPENLNGLTAHMLQHVSSANDDTLNVCCSEPPIEDESDD